jgi:molybdopterin molybdotransferase
MTGAILPQGADVVIRIEDCTIVGSGPDGIKTVLIPSADSPPNICYQGEDIQLGSIALEPGTLLDTRHVPVLAAFGKVLVKTYRQPTVGVLSTGTELVEPGETPARSQIRNTNAYQIIAQVKKLGIDAEYYGIAPDDEEVCRKMVTDALDGCDILILSGGVSMGLYDLIPSILESLGMKLEFRQIAIQPGKPTVFCTGQGKFVFGLPGNPVSSYFLFELLIKPFIYKCMGHFWNPPVVPYKLATRISRKKSDRLAWIPVRADDQGMVHPVDYHGSAHILALRDASFILPVAVGVSEIQEGTVVNVRPI